MKGRKNLNIEWENLDDLESKVKKRLNKRTDSILFAWIALNIILAIGAITIMSKDWIDVILLGMLIGVISLIILSFVCTLLIKLNESASRSKLRANIINQHIDREIPVVSSLWHLIKELTDKHAYDSNVQFTPTSIRKRIDSIDKLPHHSKTLYYKTIDICSWNKEQLIQMDQRLLPYQNLIMKLISFEKENKSGQFKEYPEKVKVGYELLIDVITSYKSNRVEEINEDLQKEIESVKKWNHQYKMDEERIEKSVAKRFENPHKKHTFNHLFNQRLYQ